MSLWIIALFMIVQAASWVVFFSIQKNLNHVVKSHINIMGEENAAYIKTKILMTAKVAYGVMMGVFTAGSYVLLWIMQ